MSKLTSKIAQQVAAPDRDLVLFPADAQHRLCSAAMALDAAIELCNEAGDHKVLGILDLVHAELSRLNDEAEAIGADAAIARSGDHVSAVEVAPRH